MGHKVHPGIIRLGINKSWNTIWYANKNNFVNNLDNDFKVRTFLIKKLPKTSISKIKIERLTKSIRITIYTSRPGLIIGKKGEDIEKIRKSIVNITGMVSQINISEIKKPELDAKLVANNIALQLEKRMAFRKVMKRAVQNALRLGSKGIKIEINGRLNGIEIARREWYREGQVPLHTLRADIDYNTAEAYTTYGTIGVKVWIFTGEILNNISETSSEIITTHIKKKSKKYNNKVTSNVTT